MEPVESKIKNQNRYILVLGKYRVLERTETHMRIALGGSTVMTVSLPPQADVKTGDVLTLYTEVLYANPEKPSIQ
jgi:hypothetical protein